MRRAWAAGVLAALAIGGTGAAQTTAQTAAQSAPQAPPAVGPKVDAPGKLPEPAPSVPDLAYDARLLSSAAAAQQFQGALDGGWTVTAARAGAGDLYGLQITDKRDELSGAWRDLRRPGQPGASGLIDEIARTPQALVIRFRPTPGVIAVITVRPAADGLRGELVQGAQTIPILLRKAHA